MPRAENVAKMLRKDLAAAGIAYKDEDDKVEDFHALRHTCGSWLMAANVNPKIIQQVMRHSTITLTMDRYTHALKADGVRAVNQLPELSSGPVEDAETGPPSPDRLGVSLGASGTKPCDFGRQHETEATKEGDDSAQEKTRHSLVKQVKTGSKRRGRDSNPRYTYYAYDDLANRCLQPLGHLSGKGGSLHPKRDCSSDDAGGKAWATTRI